MKTLRKFIIYLLCNLIFSIFSGLLDASSLQRDVDVQVYKLQHMNINRRKVTISGFSAGASMTNQLYVAHSSLFSGAAIFSQAFYRCGPNSLLEFGIRCSKSGYEIIPYNVNAAVEDARKYEEQGLIDPLGSLRNQKVFIWTGSLDEYIPERMAAQNVDFYKRFIPSPQISLKIERAKHLFPTDNFGAGCDQNAEHNYYLGNCNYSGAFEALNYLLGDSMIRKANEEFYPSQLMVFDQSEFYNGNITEVAMGNLGIIYIPKLCENHATECLLHFNFHGCNEWTMDLARNYTLHNGFLPLGEANNIIVVFPLTTAVPSNMNGCWDFFSYTGKYFATKQGRQIQVVHRMIQRLLGDLIDDDLLLT